VKKIRGDKLVGVIIHIYMEISQGNSLCSYPYLKLKCQVFSFYLFFFIFYKIREQKGGTSPEGGAGINGRGRVLGKNGKEGEYGTKMCIHVSKCKNDTS
jgi:hypothetical protein